MKKTILMLLLLTIPVITMAQVKGKKSKKPITAFNDTTYKVGDIIELGEASNESKFAFVYEQKGLSLKSITSAVKSVKEVKNMNLKSVKNIANNIEKVQNLADGALISQSMSGLMNQAVSEKYVSENALSNGFSNTKWKIHRFKIYTDKDTNEQIVHAICKGKGKTIAILLDFALKTNEIKG